MPIFKYFLFVGAALTGILVWLGNEYPPSQTALISSQAIGVPKYKPEPEPKHARVTTVNFAAAYAQPASKPDKIEAARHRQRVTASVSESPPLKRFAEFPHGNLSIH